MHHNGLGRCVVLLKDPAAPSTVTVSAESAEMRINFSCLPGDPAEPHLRDLGPAHRRQDKMSKTDGPCRAFELLLVGFL